jgi:hypothetical protein
MLTSAPVSAQANTVARTSWLCSVIGKPKRVFPGLRGSIIVSGVLVENDSAAAARCSNMLVSSGGGRLLRRVSEPGHTVAPGDNLGVYETWNGSRSTFRA